MSASLALRDVLAFLDLDPAFAPAFTKVNKNKAVRFPRLSRAVAACGDPGVKNLLPEGARRGLRRTLRRFNVKSATRVPRDPGVRHALMMRVRPDVEHLSRVLQRDLVRLWGYP